MKTTKLVSVIFAVIMMIGLLTCTVFADGVVAEIDGVGYETLEAAIDVAEEDDTITLMTDIELAGATASVVAAGDGEVYAMADGVTLDLGGNTIKITEGDYLAFAGNDITITKGSIENGGIAAVGGTLTLSEIEITVNPSKWEYAVWSLKKGTEVTIVSGKYANGKIGHDVLAEDKGKIVLEGGMFKFFNNETKKYLADGYMVVDGEEDPYNYTVVRIVAEIGGVEYATLEDAIAAADAGTTITLATDIELAGEKASVVAAGDGKVYKMADGVTLDLGGNTIKITAGDYLAFAGTDITITNGSIKNGGIAAVGGTLTLSEIEITVNPSKWKYAVWSLKKGTTVTIVSGKYAGSKIGHDVLAEDKGKIVLEGGMFKFFNNETKKYLADGYTVEKNAAAPCNYTVIAQ